MKLVGNDMWADRSPVAINIADSMTHSRRRHHRRRRRIKTRMRIRFRSARVNFEGEREERKKANVPLSIDRSIVDL